MDQQESFTQEPDYTNSEVIQATTLRTVRNLKKLQQSNSNIIEDFSQEKTTNDPDPLSNLSINSNKSKYVKPSSTDAVKQSSALTRKKLSSRGTTNRLDLKKRSSITHEDRNSIFQQNHFRQDDLQIEDKLQGSTTTLSTPVQQTFTRQRLQSAKPKIKLANAQLSSQDFQLKNSNNKEAFQIDINNALNLVLQKSKNMREKIEQFELSPVQVSGKLTSTLTNVPKSTLTMLENHTTSQIEKCIRLDKISEQFTQVQKSIEKQFERKLQEIQDTLQMAKI